ncbi:protein THYLAKOID ASSEMBLY 8, chloroplastic [Heracleum sosnowskyi]|uniref:Protein THYLAKOID ASSEMBLY 8, chloroplastic n=1 Tax=Heracleum sosnowskyi TaxID=360622 RepID=A0AAD8H689_9APIA|nr:protein THYLAKOID ASSEMBLY 8, chloroplastic [Heracleum sosnowskyi]
MASSSLHSILSFPSALPQTHKPNPASTKPPFTIRCGPRDKRGPLVKGRILSIEAIQAVQSLKRCPQNDAVLSRLLKSDLIAAFNELLRQEQIELAVKVFSAIRSELWYTTDLAMYASLVSALSRKGKREEIDLLIRGLSEEDVGSDDKRLVLLIKALIHAGRLDSTVRIYRLMRRSGWGPTCAADDYVVRVLINGLRRLGEENVANELLRDFGTTNF